MPPSPLFATAKRILVQCGLAVAAVAILLTGSVFTVKALTGGGFIGTHGIFTVNACSVHVSHSSGSRHGPSASHEYDCTGNFRAGDGTFTDDHATVDSVEQNYPGGTLLPAEGRPGNALIEELTGGSYTLADTGAVTKYLLYAFTALLLGALLAFGLLAVDWKDSRPESGSWQAVGRAARAKRGRLITAAVFAVALVILPATVLALTG
ncbi:hypothetical protein [Streptomyces pinistramenti]|uniref:hypothetical protein n=1 Tax=Streptomyces pinistramenti TaxID=2884812 RepID=UPI001D08DF75|nr:hypothetical protein [Streptomyces pinistramenti]MCB5911950.1 hypothetical protein [Streptomyces pinistramenti]